MSPPHREYDRIDAAFDRVTDFCLGGFASVAVARLFCWLFGIPRSHGVEAVIAIVGGVCYAVFGPRPKRMTVHLTDE